MVRECTTTNLDFAQLGRDRAGEVVVAEVYARHVRQEAKLRGDRAGVTLRMGG